MREPDTPRLRPERLSFITGRCATSHYASMAIGRLIRRDKRAIFVMPNSECLSSCVFILAGGVMRYVAADPARPTQVGIHRPYDPGDTLTTAGQQKLRYAQVEKDAKA